MLVKAPAGGAANPVPFKVRGSAFETVKPFKSKTAPEVTDVIPATAPRTVELAPTLSVPALTVVQVLAALAAAGVAGY